MRARGGGGDRHCFATYPRLITQQPPSWRMRLSFGGKHAVSALTKKRPLTHEHEKEEGPGVAAPAAAKKQQQQTTLALIKTATATTVIKLMPPAAAPALPSQLFSLSVSWSELRELEPNSIQAAILMPDSVKQPVLEWVQRRLGRGDGPKLALLTGPSGCGKSTFVRTVAKVLGMECVEPDVINLADVVRTLREDVCTNKFKLGRKSGTVKPRLWLFSGMDGYFRGAAGAPRRRKSEEPDRLPQPSAAQLLDDIFKLLTTSGKALPPIIFTLHDFEGPAMFNLRKSPLVVRFSTNRPNPQDATQRAMCARVVTRLCVAANQVALADVVAREAMACFDGDLKQLMLRGECALRMLHKSGAPAKPFASKDTELVDPFYTLRLVYDTKTKLPLELLANVFDSFSLMPVLLTKNYMAALPYARTTAEQARVMAAMAACADAFSELATYDEYWEVKDVQAVGRIYALGSVRYHRDAVNAITVPRNATLDCTARRPWEKSHGARAVNKYRLEGAPSNFRLSALECVERLAMEASPFAMDD